MTPALWFLAGMAAMAAVSFASCAALVLVALWGANRRERREALERVSATLKLHGKRLRFYIAKPSAFIGTRTWGN